ALNSQKPEWRPRSGAAPGSVAGSHPARRRLWSGFETKNRRVHCLGRTHRIEVFAKVRDLAAFGTQEEHILLAIGTPRSLDQRLRLDFGDCRFRIGGGLYPEVEEAEVLHRPQEPGYVTHHLLPPR
ncbi:MAG: hypothetical protein ACREQA_00810, partial [Candidatus Binatia bacterium]